MESPTNGNKIAEAQQRATTTTGIRRPRPYRGAPKAPFGRRFHQATTPDLLWKFHPVASRNHDPKSEQGDGIWRVDSRGRDSARLIDLQRPYLPATPLFDGV
jgi:hypothetical protein